MSEIVTANRLGDGRVVFRAAQGWSTDIEAAERLETPEAVAAALAFAAADVAANRVVDAYAIAVTAQEGPIVPSRLRERIRAEGPTTGNSRPDDAAPAARDAAA